MKKKRPTRSRTAGGGAFPPTVAGTLLQALSASELLAALYDPRDELRWCNGAYARSFVRDLPLPLPFAELLRDNFRRGIGVRIACGDVEAFLRDILPRRRSQPYRAFETDTLDGRWLRMTETLLSDGWMLCVASDITSLKHGELLLRQAQAQAETDARTDLLTAGPNRRHVFEYGAVALARCEAVGKPCSVALIDLDHFKRVNDDHGHDVGDAVLRDFAAQMRTSLRQGDLFGRIGGEEFLLLTPGARQDTALEVTQRLRRGLQPLRLALLGELGFTFSAGVAQALPGDSMDSVLTRADRALYRAKLLGRNRSEPAGAADGSGLNTAASS